MLWLWCRLAAAAPIWPLVWELPYAIAAALKKKKEKKKKKKAKPPLDKVVDTKMSGNEKLGSIGSQCPSENISLNKTGLRAK